MLRGMTTLANIFIFLQKIECIYSPLHPASTISISDDVISWFLCNFVHFVGPLKRVEQSQIIRAPPFSRDPILLLHSLMWPDKTSKTYASSIHTAARPDVPTDVHNSIMLNLKIHSVRMQLDQRTREMPHGRMQFCFSFRVSFSVHSSRFVYSKKKSRSTRIKKTKHKNSVARKRLADLPSLFASKEFD